MCGGDAWDPIVEAMGVVVSTTRINKAVSTHVDRRPIALIQVFSGDWVIAAVATSAISKGDRVVLKRDGDSVIALPAHSDARTIFK